MRKLRALFILGVWVSLLSYLGFPIVIKNILFVVSGLLILFVVYLLYSENKKTEAGSRLSHTSMQSVANNFGDIHTRNYEPLEHESMTNQVKPKPEIDVTNFPKHAEVHTFEHPKKKKRENQSHDLTVKIPRMQKNQTKAGDIHADIVAKIKSRNTS